MKLNQCDVLPINREGKKRVEIEEKYHFEAKLSHMSLKQLLGNANFQYFSLGHNHTTLVEET